jgi:hypothetical protein
MNNQPETHQSSCLSIGYFEDFADPTLLIWGDARALIRLADLLDYLPLSREDQIWFSQLPWITRHRSTNVALRIVEHGSKVCRLEIQYGNHFEIGISATDARTLAEQVRAIVSADQPSHAYVDIENANGVTVLVSAGEYPEDWPAEG